MTTGPAAPSPRARGREAGSIAALAVGLVVALTALTLVRAVTRRLVARVARTSSAVRDGAERFMDGGRHW